MASNGGGGGVLRHSNSSRLSRMSFSGDDGRNAQPAAPGAEADRPMVTFARRTHSGRYVSYSRDDLDSDLANNDLGAGGFSPDWDEYLSYHVHIPATPDNQPMDPAISARVEEQYVSNSLFTGSFNSVTRAHLMDKVIESEASHPQMAGSKGSSCAVNGCDGKVMSDERGQDILPCECDFKICSDCFGDAVKNAGALCPGCKEPYKSTEMEDLVGAGQPTLSLPPPPGGGVPVSKMERRLSIVRSQKAMTRSQTGDWDHNRWLFETKGTYGYGNAIWPKENEVDNGGGGGGGGLGGDGGQPAEFTSKPWRPLTRKLKIRAAILSPYRKILQQELFDHRILTLLKNWQEPLPDGSLLNMNIRTAIPKLLSDAWKRSREVTKMRCIGLVLAPQNFGVCSSSRSHALPRLRPTRRAAVLLLSVRRHQLACCRPCSSWLGEDAGGGGCEGVGAGPVHTAAMALPAAERLRRPTPRASCCLEPGGVGEDSWLPGSGWLDAWILIAGELIFANLLQWSGHVRLLSAVSTSKGNFTGPKIFWSGSSFRTEATGYGLVFCARVVLADMNKELKGLRCAISGSGKIAMHVLEKLLSCEAIPVTVSDSKGYLLDGDGFDYVKYSLIRNIKAQQKSLKEYLKTFPRAKYIDDAKPWGEQCDVAFPCASQNEIDQGEALAIVTSGCRVLIECSNMPCTAQAVDILRKAKVHVAPAKATAAGGVAVGELELNSEISLMQWSVEDFENKIQDAVKQTYDRSMKAAHDYGIMKENPESLVHGANISAFLNIAQAMTDQGCV